MVSERIYDLCRPVLENETLDEEEKMEQVEELLSRAPSSLKGKALEDAVLGAFWQWRSATEKNMKGSPPPRGDAAAKARSRSPAPWLQRTGTPGSGTSSPRPATVMANLQHSGPPGSIMYTLARHNSSTASPFASPKPSPRLPVATPAIPHSPRLSIYQFSASSPSTENYGEYGSDTVDWLLHDDASSTTSYSDAADFGPSYPSYTPDMSPYDMLRSILQDYRSDEELEQSLAANGYDLSRTINSLMEADADPRPGTTADVMSSPPPSTLTLDQQKSPIVCRYWLASGYCARADCRFSHEAQHHVCKYWLQGHCLAGNNCLFSHDPAALMQQLNIANSAVETPQQLPPNFQLEDYDSFPALQPTTSNPYEDSPGIDSVASNVGLQQQAIFQPPGIFPAFVPSGSRHGSHPNSRPGSRHASRAPTPSEPNFQDDEAFPTLGTAAAKPGKRHHGKRGGHGHHNLPPHPNSMADVIRLSPSPGPNSNNSREVMRRGLRNNRSFTSSRENSTTAMNIPPPNSIPWLETGVNANQVYMKARQEAFKHGGLRNKFLQSAAQAWNRNDARGAKTLSLRGQNENSLMREKHREAARALYEARNKHQSDGGARAKEIYVDLHGLHPVEAVSYLSDCLKDHSSAESPVYAICGTGHHSKNGKDKVGKAIRLFLNESKYAFREFSVPGDRNNVGGILGIDPSSHDKEISLSRRGLLGVSRDSDSGVGLDDANKHDTKVLLVKEDPRKTMKPLASGEDVEEDS